MFKITKGSTKNTYKIECYVYNVSALAHDFMYSIDNIREENMVSLLQGRVLTDYSNNEWMSCITNYTDALIDEDGKTRPIPIIIKKREYYEEHRNKQEH